MMRSWLPLLFHTLECFHKDIWTLSPSIREIPLANAPVNLKCDLWYPMLNFFFRNMPIYFVDLQIVAGIFYVLWYECLVEPFQILPKNKNRKASEQKETPIIYEFHVWDKRKSHSFKFTEPFYLWFSNAEIQRNIHQWFYCLWNMLPLVTLVQVLLKVFLLQ